MALPGPLHLWLPIDGGARILPLIRHADALCSNSYIISTPSRLMVIDPGADELQTDQIRQVLLEEGSGSSRPVLFFLTHCHHDHSRSLEYWQAQREIPVRLFAHASGAAAMASGSRDFTLSYIYSQNFPQVSIDGPLSFSEGADQAFPEVLITPEADLSGIKRRRLHVEKDLFLDIFQTPGHSPDSLCFRLGRILFTGDVLLADKPGVAGIPGWSQQQLLQTLRFFEFLLREGDTTACCPGHGPPLESAHVLGLLEAARANTRNLNRLICFDDRRIDFLKASAVALAREASLQLAALGGRLHLAAHRLDELGEEELARGLAGGIDLDAMESFLVQFQDFAAGHERDSFRPAIPLRGIQIIEKIAGLLARAGIPPGIADVNMRRIELLLRDYVHIVAGMDHRDFLRIAHAPDLVREALDMLQPPDLSGDEADAAAEDPALFGRFLARRLYPLPDTSRFAVRPPDGDLPPVRTDPERMIQLFADCIEHFATAAASAEIRFTPAKGCVEVSLRAPAGSPVLSATKAGYYQCVMGLLGARFVTGPAGQACFLLPVAD